MDYIDLKERLEILENKMINIEKKIEELKEDKKREKSWIGHGYDNFFDENYPELHIRRNEFEFFEYEGDFLIINKRRD